MMQQADIIVNIVHIEGPLKGEIQEFSDAEILIGRNLDCQVRFPKDLLIVSRDHARVIREGNRFKLINKSANLTYLNGKPVGEEEEAYLKSGDWMMFAEGGPKVSFLTKVVETRQSPSFQTESPAAEEESSFDRAAKQIPLKQPSLKPSPSQQAPLVIRFGPKLHRFKSLPVTIGRSADCDLKLDHAAISDRHAEIFYRDGQYWVRDLTGKQSIFIDGVTISSESPLITDNKLGLTHQGPVFRFLGDGRLDEIIE